jgi:hypothetical protein
MRDRFCSPSGEDLSHHGDASTLLLVVPPRPHNELAYYTVADASFFPGAVALLNSLRMAGEVAPLFVVDCGLTDSQKQRLSDHATIIRRNEGLHPQLQKGTGPLAHPADVMVVIDADILITRPLAPLIEAAAEGQLVAFRDDYLAERFFPAWSSLGLGIPQRRPYINSGFLAFSAGTGQKFLPMFVKLQERLDPAAAGFGGAAIADPFYFPDQDILNAMLSTKYDALATRLEHRLMPVPPFPGIEIKNGRLASCRYADGAEPYGLHHILAKPWLARTQPNLYSELFASVVTSPHACVRLRSEDIPLRLSDSRLAPIDRWRVSMQIAARQRLRGKLGLRPAIARRRAKCGGWTGSTRPKR